MKIEESLTKENFWNEIYEKYPNACKIFCDWIDEYKKEVNWNSLFRSKLVTTDIIDGQLGSKQVNFKFHDIPHAMQLGIFIAFVKDFNAWYFEPEDLFTEELKAIIDYQLGAIESSIEFKNKKYTGEIEDI